MFPETNVILNIGSDETKGTADKISMKFDFSLGDFVLNDGKVSECTGEDALKIWIEKVIRTEKERYTVYDDTNYGVVLEDLIVGSVYPKAFIESELKREIEEALLQNSEITGVSYFEVLHVGHKLTVSFKVNTITNSSLEQEVMFSV